MNAMYYTLLFHLLQDLPLLDNFLLHFELLHQIFHLSHLFYILKYLNRLGLLRHNCLNFLFLIKEILLYYMLVFQIACQSEPKLVLMKLALHSTRFQNYLHFPIIVFFLMQLMFDLHQMLYLHNAVTMSRQLNILFFIILINFIF